MGWGRLRGVMGRRKGKREGVRKGDTRGGVSSIRKRGLYRDINKIEWARKARKERHHRLV